MYKAGSKKKKISPIHFNWEIVVFHGSVGNIDAFILSDKVVGLRYFESLFDTFLSIALFIIPFIINIIGVKN